MVSSCKALAGAIITSLVLCLFGSFAPAAAKPQLKVSISLDIPPYVMIQASGGLEVDILQQVLGDDYDLQFVQLPYEQLQTAVPDKVASVSVGVQPDDQAVYYSSDFITFANYAISKKSDRFLIVSIADLRDHQLLTWENAYLVLGSEFEEMYQPQAPLRKNYHEVADQEQQVRRFWQEPGQVIIIDHSIFNYFSRTMGYDLDEASYHAIFPLVTNFRVGFADAAMRDRFDDALAAMCASGEYAELMKRYGVAVKQAVCQ